MKSIMYVGATLMIGACIYGFVDYKKTSNSKEFKSLYREEKTTEPDKEISTFVPVAEKTVVLKDETKKTEVAPAIKKKKDVMKEEKEFKRLDAELFSRAPLRRPKKVSEAVVVDSLEIQKAVR